MSRLFKTGISYPHDGVGRYVPLQGCIVKVRDPGYDTSAVLVRVPDLWDFTTYWDSRIVPSGSFPAVGRTAQIRVYDGIADNVLESWGGPCGHPECVVAAVLES